MTNTNGTATEAPTVILIDPKKISPHPDNPRGEIRADDPDTITLRTQIEANGQTTPCLVRIRPETKGYQAILGHRRRFVLEQLGREVQAIVAELDDETALALMIADFESHKGADPLKEAEAIAKLLGRPGWTVSSVALTLGKDARWVAARANLRTLGKKFRGLAAKPDHFVSKWPLEWLEEVAKLDPAAQDVFAEQVRWVRDRKELDRQLAEYFHLLGKAPWKLDDETLVPKAGPCTTCPKTSLATPGLFDDDLEAKDVRKATCRDGTCWAAKIEAHGAHRYSVLRGENPDAVVVLPYTHRVPEFLKSAKVVSAYEVEKVGKSAKGAQPAIFYNDDPSKAVPQVQWIKLDKHASPSAVKKVEKAKKGEKKESEAESKAAIAERRNAFFVDEVKAQLGKLKAPEDLQVVMSLAAAYSVVRPSGTYGASAAKRKKLYDDTHSDHCWIEEVWPRLRPNVAESLDRATNDCPEQLKAARWLCEVLEDHGLDAAAIEAKAVKEIPDPKWWGTSSPAPEPKVEKPAEKKPAKKVKARG